MEELRGDIAQVASLLNKSDPPEKPFESKYEARVILESMRTKVSSYAAGGNTLAKAISVHVLTRIGSIDHEVEEIACSQVNIMTLIATILKIYS